MNVNKTFPANIKTKNQNKKFNVTLYIELNEKNIVIASFI